MSQSSLPVLLIILGAALACKGKDAAEEKKEHAEVAATVGTAESGTFSENIDAAATVVARPGHVAALAAPAPTRVSRVFVTVGAKVGAGDALVEFEQAPFAAALNSANAALGSAEKAAARALRLADAGVSPRKEAETAATELATAQQNVATARRSSELATLRAPMAGVVTRLSAVMGASVEPSQSLVEVADVSLVDVVLTVSPADAMRVHSGQSVSLMINAGAAAEPVAMARVADVSPAVDTMTRGVAVRAEVSSGAGALRIGSTLTGRILTAEHGKATIIPADALVPTGEGFKVFVVDKDGMALSREVTVGGRSAKGVWISKGLAAGEHIVTKGAYGMDDSAKVAGSAGKEPDAAPAAKAAKEPGAAPAAKAAKKAP